MPGHKGQVEHVRQPAVINIRSYVRALTPGDPAGHDNQVCNVHYPISADVRSLGRRFQLSYRYDTRDRYIEHLFQGGISHPDGCGQGCHQGQRQNTPF